MSGYRAIKINLFLIFFILIGTLLSPVQAGESGSELRVMTYNIRCLSPDGFDSWWFRRDHVAGLIREFNPDLLGMQEVYTLQARDIENRLDGYAWFGKPRGKWWGQRNTIFYRTDRFELIRHDTFWLSESPDKPGSRSWGTNYKRTVTWGKFRDKNSGEKFFFFNTHFDHKSVPSRKNSALLLIERIKDIAHESLVIVTGDFNCTDTSMPYKTIAAYLNDARKITRTQPKGPVGTFWGFKRHKKPKDRIDFIFTSKGFNVLSYVTSDHTYDKGRHTSDHLPVMVILEKE